MKYQEVICLSDSQGRNVLHHAVLKQHSDIVKKLIHLDSDYSKLRNLKDTKGKTPAQYDEKSLYKDLFETIWDAAKKGNSDRLVTLVK
jgi:ankyrin repeat protein